MNQPVKPNEPVQPTEMERVIGAILGLALCIILGLLTTLS